jgi:hypothetical protein
MDQHLGISIPLSFALVVVFAIVLYQPDRVQVPRASTGPPARTQAPPVPLPLPPPVPVAAPREPLPALTPSEPLELRPTEKVVVPPAAPREPRRGPAPPVQEGFTQTLEGETLRDVAVRVYGSPDEADSLWRLNRDLIRRRQGALPPGTLLRTP